MRTRFLVSLAIADIVALALAVTSASWAVFQTWPWNAPPDSTETLWPLIGFFLVGGVTGIALTSQSWRYSAPRPSYGRALTIVSIATVVAAMLLIVTDAYRSRLFFALVPVIWFLGAASHRAWWRNRPWSERMIVIADERGLVDELRKAPHAEVLQTLKPTDQAPDLPPETGVVLIIDLRSVLGESMAQYVSSCSIGGTKVRALTTVYEEHTGRFPLVHLAEGWELRIPASRSTTYQLLKVWIDKILIIFTAWLWIPMAIAIWVLIRLDSPGKAIFRQERVGRNGQTFVLRKFRTMVCDADSTGARMTTVEDDRITRVGRHLRRFRVDEIPQLWNVLVGEQSLVGPRPEQVPIVELFREEIPYYEQRHLVRPGVTGWAQVHYGYADDQADTIEKLAFDLYYVKNLSPWTDLHVLLKSIWTVLSGFGHQ